MKINWFDMLIYKIWYWRWNRILRKRSDIRELFISYLKSYDSLDDGEKIKVTVKIEKAGHE